MLRQDGPALPETVAAVGDERHESLCLDVDGTLHRLLSN